MRYTMPCDIMMSTGMIGRGDRHCVFIQVKGADEPDGRL